VADVQGGDFRLAELVEDDAQGAQGVAVRDDEHRAALTQVAVKWGAPERVDTRPHIIEGLGSGHGLRRQVAEHRLLPQLPHQILVH